MRSLNLPPESRAKSRKPNEAAPFSYPAAAQPAHRHGLAAGVPVELVVCGFLCTVRTRHSTLRLHYMGDSAESRANYLCPASPENRRQCLLGRDNARSPHCGATGVECPAPVPDKRSSRCLRRWRYTRTRRLALGFRRLWECNPACSIDPPAAENLPQDINVVSGYPPISLPQINGAGNARQ